MSSRRIGLVLSGGGARGAYEIGALLHIAEELPELFSRIRVVTGTSVGAVNAAFLAGRGMTRESVHELAAIWRSLVIDDMIGLDSSSTFRVLSAGAMRLIGRDVASPAGGLLAIEGITKLVNASIDWHGIRRTIQSGRLDAIAVAATDIGSGSTHLFVSHRVAHPQNWSSHDETLLHKRVALRAHHVLASAAIPILFPPVAIGSRWYMDGGVRYNTPLSPALSLGAESLLIVTVRAPTEAALAAPTGEFPGFGQVVGKLLDSVFLDRVAFDIDRLTRINDMIQAVELLGERAVARMHEELGKRGRRMYRVVPFATVRPAKDLGALAASHLTRAAKAGRTSFAQVLKMLFLDDSGTTGDAASFLLFDGGYAEELLREGRRDAEASHDALAQL
jgi:NTE family protein